MGNETAVLIALICSLPHDSSHTVQECLFLARHEAPLYDGGICHQVWSTKHVFMCGK